MLLAMGQMPRKLMFGISCYTFESVPFHALANQCSISPMTLDQGGARGELGGALAPPGLAIAPP